MTNETSTAAGTKTRNWYIVHTYSGFEERVRQNLKQRIEAMGMADAFGRWLEATLGPRGLVLYDASDPAAKPLVAGLFARELETAGTTARLATASAPYPENSGSTTPPIAMTPKNAATSSGHIGMKSATRSPRPMPMRRRPLAQR